MPTLESMTDTLGHRGPDDAGVWVSAGGGVALGHRRLSIVDLSPLGHNPMTWENGRYWITYNGEIYNFQELRDELETLGCRFVSQTDTEVILAAYERWGLDCLDRFIGMFAFALWDRDRETLVIARDRLGKKPLYYSQYGGRVAIRVGAEGDCVRSALSTGTSIAARSRCIFDSATCRRRSASSRTPGSSRRDMPHSSENGDRRRAALLGSRAVCLRAAAMPILLPQNGSSTRCWPMRSDSA